MQLAYPAWSFGCQPRPQRVGEQVVIAIPLPLLIEWNDEYVAAIEGLKRCAAVVSSGEPVAKLPLQLVQHRGGDQELAGLLALASEHLLDEVVQNKSMATTERINKIAHCS